VATAEEARRLISASGTVRLQPPTEWSGPFPIPPEVERFYSEVGPVDVCIESFGNAFFLPSLAKLWEFQAGYRWDGLTGEPVADWQDDWLVVADQGGDPFILSRSSGEVLHDEHGRGEWEPGQLFPDLTTMAACLGLLGAVVAKAGKEFTDDQFRIRPKWRAEAVAGLGRLLGSPRDAEDFLHSFGWGSAKSS
jgi:hypothetical protein